MREDILLDDRSGMELDWKCGMAYYWNRVHGGTGIVPAEEADYFIVGRNIHEDFDHLARMPEPGVRHGGDLEAALWDYAQGLIPSTSDQMALEIAYRRAGWFLAYGMFIEPLIRKEWENVSIENEIILDRTPLWMCVTPDRIMRHRKDRILVYEEYKSTKFNNKGWQDYWPYAVQIHLGLLAVEEELGEKLAYGLIRGLEKGYEKDGKLRHPYVYGYWNEKTDLWQVEYKYGLTLRPVWEYPGGLLEWVKLAGEETAKEMFPVSRPIFLNRRIIEPMIERRIIRMREIKAWKDGEWVGKPVEDVFEARYTQCNPVIGAPCAYLGACHNGEINADPIGSGVYVPRVPHHEIESVMKGRENG